MRFTWLSNAPWSTSGYGCQTRHFVKRFLKDGHDVAVIANYGHQGSPLNFEGIKVYGQAFHPFCADVANADTNEFKAQLMFSFMDVWVMNGIDMGLKWVQWIPIDHDPVPPPVAQVAATAYRRIAISKFGQNRLNAIGLPSGYVPNGVETDVFKPMDVSDEHRKIFGIPKDKFVVGMVASNKGDPPRKAFWANIAAFAELHKRHPDTCMYIHAYTGEPPKPETINIPAYCRAIGLEVGKDVLFPNEHNLILGFPDAVMAEIYNCMDVHLLVSMGEGFGIPIVEAQACGVPVIVGDWTSMSELCFSGWKVDKKEAEPWWGPLQSWMYLPHIGAIVERLEAAYQMKGNRDYKERARAGALKYDCDYIMEKYWRPELKYLEEMLSNDDKTTFELNGVIQ